MKHEGLIVHVASMALLAGIWSGWWAVSAFEFISPVFLPTPSDVAQVLWNGLVSGGIGAEMFATVRRMTYGWLLASLAGVMLGAAVGVSRTARTFLQPSLEFVRPLPASAVMPVAIALFGLSEEMVLVVIAFGALWPVLLATTHGFSSVEARLAEVAQLLHMSRREFIAKIGLPNALPDIFAGMRLSLTVALIVSVVGEMLTSQQGLGLRILLAARTYQSAELFAGVVLLGLIGFVTNMLLRTAEHRVLAWKTY